MKRGALLVMYGGENDGDCDDCRFHFDMHAGELLRVDIVGRRWLFLSQPIQLRLIKSASSQPARKPNIQ